MSESKHTKLEKVEETKSLKSSESEELLKLKLKLSGELKGANPTGNLYVTQHNNLAYIGSVGAINVFDLKTLVKVLSIPVTGFAPRVEFVRLEKFSFMLIIASSSLLLYDNADVLHPILVSQLDLGMSTVVNLVVNRNDPTIWYVLTALGVVTVQIVARESPLGYTLVKKDSYALASFTDADLFADVRGGFLYVAPVVHRTLYVFSLADKLKPKLAQTVVDELVPNNLNQSTINPNVLVVGGQFGFSLYDVSTPTKLQLISQQRTTAVNNGFAQVPSSDLFVNVAYDVHSPLTVYRLENYASYRSSTSSTGKKLTLKPVSNTVIVTPGRAPWDARPIIDKHGRFVEIISTNSSEEAVQIIRVKSVKSDKSDCA